MQNDIVPSTSDNALATSGTMAALGSMAEQFTQRNGFSTYHSELTESTRRAHRTDLVTFADFLGRFAQSAGLDGDTPAPDALYEHAAAWQGVTYGMVEMFVEAMKVKGYSIATMGRKLATVRVYCNKSAELGHMPTETAAAIRGLKLPSGKCARNMDEQRTEAGHSTRIGNKKADSIFLGVDVMQRLRDAHEDTPVGRRNRLIMTMFVEFGFRVSEVASLTIGSVDIAANKLKVYRIKTDLWQTLDMTPAVRDAVLAWLDNDVAADEPKAPLLRGSHKGGVITCKGISTRSIARIVNQQGAKNGVKGLSPHDIRHSWSDINMDRVQDLPRGKDSIRTAGGWKTDAMVNRYAKDKEIANEGMDSFLD